MEELESFEEWDDNNKWWTLKNADKKANEGYKYVPEILSITHKHMHSNMGLGVCNGNESYRKHFYDNKLIPAYSIIGRKIKFSSYDEMIESSPEECEKNNLMDWEAEYCAYVSDIVIKNIREYEK